MTAATGLPAAAHQANLIRPGPLAAPAADLLRALQALRPSDEASLAAILHALGHAPGDTGTRRATSSGQLPPVPSKPPRIASRDRREERPAARTPLASEIEVQLSVGGEVPAWMTEAALLPLLGEGTPGDPRTGDYGAVLRAVMPSLLAPRRQRSLVAHLASRFLPLGELDLEAVVQAIVERRPLDALPRRQVASLAAGVQLLCDSGPGMEPFALDTRDLSRLVLAVAGRDRVRVEHFIGCPSRGTLRWDGTLAPYRAPPPGQPVLAITDLGTVRVPGAAGQPDEWLAFAALLRRRNSHLAVLFPGGTTRIPAPLRGRLRVMALDRRTGVRQAASRAA